MTKSPSIDGALGRLQLGEALAQAFDPFVDLGVGDLGVGLEDLDALVVLLVNSSRGRISTTAVNTSGVSSSNAVEVDLGIGDRGEVFVA